MQELEDDKVDKVDRDYVIAHAQKQFEMENVPEIVEELYLKITKQGPYSEIRDIEDFVKELPELMCDAVKVLTAGDR